MSDIVKDPIRRATPKSRSKTPPPRSPSRLAQGGVLSAWAAAFWYLRLSGRVSLYLSGRTAWVVPIGAILFTLAAAGRVVASRPRVRETLSRREALVLTMMILPLLVILAVPPATLGTFSASRRTSSASGYWTRFGTFGADSPITLQLVAAAQTTREANQLLSDRAGSAVDFTGFVSRFADTPSDEFLLTRFVISCCVADAAIVQVRVVGVTPGVFITDEWVEVRGAIYPVGNEVIVASTEVIPVERPTNPYLTSG